MNAPLENVDKKFLGKLTELGINTPGELLFYLPKEYLDYTQPEKSVNSVLDEALSNSKKYYFRLRVCREVKVTAGFPKVTKITASDGEMEVTIVVFGYNQEWLKLKLNEEIHVVGKLNVWNEFIQVKEPELLGAHEKGKIIPRYVSKKTEKGRYVIAPKTVANKISIALEDYSSDSVAHICSRYGVEELEIVANAKMDFTSLKNLFWAIHRPRSMKEAKLALLNAKKVNAYKALIDSKQNHVYRGEVGASLKLSQDDLVSRVTNLPFSLTQSQKQCVWDIFKDLNKPVVMRRILNGDVGTGKTLTYSLPAAVAAYQGKNVVIMVPNSGLGAQVYSEISTHFPNVDVLKVFAGHAYSTKEEISGKILVGTSALLHLLPGIKDYSVDLLIIDEQQKLGQEQKQLLIGPTTHLLEASATPMPKTMAIVGHGDYDFSYLTECPYEKEIKSVLLNMEDKRRAANTLKSIVDSGRQIAIIYPLVEGMSSVAGDGERYLKEDSILNGLEHWEKMFPNQVVSLHGKMSSDEKKAALDEISRGTKKVALATTILEIGLTFPDLQGMLVLGSDRYGASTLHQFRGRLARKGGSGIFMMLPSKPIEQLNETTVSRLKLIESENNGFKIAEKDLFIRGFGNLTKSGSNQSGFEKGIFGGMPIKPEDVQLLMNN